jgi:hypothetical protein
MGTKLLDKFTYLHFANGILVYYWGMSLTVWLIIHTIFETLENSAIGIHFIDNYLTLWPGGKLIADSYINRIGDTIGAIFGWLSALCVTNYFI